MVFLGGGGGSIVAQQIENFQKPSPMWTPSLPKLSQLRGESRLPYPEKMDTHRVYFGCGSKQMAPSLVDFSGYWDVHWRYGLLTHSHLTTTFLATCMALEPARWRHFAEGLLEIAFWGFALNIPFSFWGGGWGGGDLLKVSQLSLGLTSGPELRPRPPAHSVRGRGAESGTASSERWPKARGPNSWRPRTTATMGFVAFLELGTRAQGSVWLSRWFGGLSCSVWLSRCFLCWWPGGPLAGFLAVWLNRWFGEGRGKPGQVVWWFGWLSLRPAKAETHQPEFHLQLQTLQTIRTKSS